MKTRVASLLFVVLMLTTTQCMTQNRITVSAQNNDISNNLDLKAVATAFGESKNLQDFEQRLNDYDSGISNLDLNNDGQVDYLRVIEKTDNNIHVVVIQAVLGKDVFQDVATIVVDRDNNSNTSVQIIGDPYIYGDNYIIEPSYLYTPSIFSWFWGSNYNSWYSPYYWGYYPNYYRYRQTCDLNLYLSNIYNRVDHNQRYYYTNSIRNDRAMRIQNSIRRNDFANRHPDNTFSNRNQNVRNKREIEFNRNGVVRNNQTQQTQIQESSSGSRIYNNSNGSRNIQGNGYNQRNANQGTYNIPSDSRNMNNPANGNTIQNRSNTNQSVNNNNNAGGQNSSVNRNQNAPSNQNYTPSSTNRNTNNNFQRNNSNTYQQSVNQNNVDRNNSRNRNNENTQRAPVSQPTQVQQRTPTVQPAQVQRPAATSQPAVRESRQVDNSNKSDSRR